MPKGRVLVIDDAIEMSRAIAEFLQRSDFEAEAVDSGAAGLERFRAAPADAVLTDLRMTGVDGMDVLQAIHEIDPDVPVIIMTAFGAIESAVESIQRGAFHYVAKPFKLDVVRVLLERAVREPPPRFEVPVVGIGLRDRVVGTEHARFRRSAGVQPM